MQASYIHSLAQKLVVCCADRFVVVQRAAITAQQYEDHIEYLKGELARAISQLNSSRAEVEESKESLRQAHSKIATLNSKLTSLESELASKGPDPTVSSSQQRCLLIIPPHRTYDAFLYL